MPGNRIGRINEEIQRELAEQIRHLKDPRVSAAGMVSITRVDTTADLRYARVYVSVLDKAREKDVMKGLKSAGGYLRREIGQALRLRYTPELQFQADDSILRGANVLQILRTVEYAPDDDTDDTAENLSTEDSTGDIDDDSAENDNSAENTVEHDSAEDSAENVDVSETGEW